MSDLSRRDGLAREEAAQAKADTRAQRARDTADRRVADLEAEKESWRFKKSDRLRELLAKRVVMRDRDLGLVFLLDWNGERITHGYQFEQATKAAQEIGRKAASAGNAIAEIQSTLERKCQITPDEQAVLAAARSILADIHGRATHIKERARAAGTQKQKEDAARAQAAQAAVGKAFPALTSASIADAVRIALFLDLRHDYHFDELRAMRPATVERFDLGYHTEQFLRSLTSSLSYRVEQAMKAGQDATTAVTVVRDAYDAALDVIEPRAQPIIANVKTCQVALQLKEANATAKPC